jgi:hypothetical protein
VTKSWKRCETNDTEERSEGVKWDRAWVSISRGNVSTARKELVLPEHERLRTVRENGDGRCFGRVVSLPASSKHRANERPLRRSRRCALISRDGVLGRKRRRRPQSRRFLRVIACSSAFTPAAFRTVLPMERGRAPSFVRVCWCCAAVMNAMLGC